jgi:hypothetical protein
VPEPISAPTCLLLYRVATADEWMRVLPASESSAVVGLLLREMAAHLRDMAAPAKPAAPPATCGGAGGSGELEAALAVASAAVLERLQGLQGLMRTGLPPAPLGLPLALCAFANLKVRKGAGHGLLGIRWG